MANIIIERINGKPYCKMGFNDDTAEFGFSFELFWAEDLRAVKLSANGKIVVVETSLLRTNWEFSFDGHLGTFKIDSVDGVEPTDNEDLATLLADLKPVM